MIPKHILRQVKNLEITTRRLVNTQLAGEYKTSFKGQGMTFADFREYVAGDDVRAISWALTARTGKPYVKKFEEERELNLIFVVDVSGSFDFGSNNKAKGVVAAEATALLALSAAQNKDPVGLLLVSDRVEHRVPAQKGTGHVQRILRDLLYFQPKTRTTKLAVGFQALMGQLKKRSVVVVISDFIDQNYESSLRQLAEKHDVVAVVIEDPFEEQPPEMGLVWVEDLENEKAQWMDLHRLEQSALSRAQESVRVSEFARKRQQSLVKARVDVLNLSTHEDVAKSLVRFFNQRGRRGRVGK